ncbi:ABC transporter permease [Streptomycetaceae bacterium NBC_01309]
MSAQTAAPDTDAPELPDRQGESAGTEGGRAKPPAAARSLLLFRLRLHPRSRSRSRSRRPRPASIARRLLSLGVALGLWQYLTSNDITLWVRFDRLPTVTEVASEFGDQLGAATYYQDLEASLTRILTGFVLAAFAGIALGILVTRSPVAGDLLQPILEVLRPIPAIAMVPIAILVFPTDEQGITFITFLAAFFPILVSTRHGVRALPTLWEDALRTMGGGRWRTLWHVVLPGTLPSVFSGLSVGMGVSWICVISAEMISGQYGVGYRTWQAYTVVDYPGVIVGMISIGVLGWATAGLVELAGRRATRWLPREGSGR